MQWLASICVRRPVFATVLILTIVVVGFVGYSKLGVDRFPKVDFPIVRSSPRSPGASPEEVETEITDKIEEAVNTISGIDELRSISTRGRLAGHRQLRAREGHRRRRAGGARARHRVMPDLPEGIDEPGRQQARSRRRAGALHRARVAAADPRGHRVRRPRGAPALETSPASARSCILGGRKRQINVLLDPVEAAGARGSRPSTCSARSRAEHQHARAAASTPARSSLTLRVSGRVGASRRIGEIVVRERRRAPDPASRDVGAVEDGEEEAETAASIDGEPRSCSRSASSRARTPSRSSTRCARASKELTPTLPGGYKLESSATTRETHPHQRRRREGAPDPRRDPRGARRAALPRQLAQHDHRRARDPDLDHRHLRADVARWASRSTPSRCSRWRWRSASSSTTPSSCSRTSSASSTRRRCEPLPAAIHAHQGDRPRVLATTLSLIAVFLPVAFMGGIPGRFLRSFGMTMAFAIAVSLLVSFTLTPMLASRWLRLDRRRRSDRAASRARALVDVVYRPIERVYMAMLALRDATTAGSSWSPRSLTLGSCVPLVKAVPKGFLPKNDEAQFEISVRAPEGTSLAATELVAERIAREMRELPEVQTTLVTIGDDQQKTPNLARIYVKLLRPTSARLSQDELQDKVRRRDRSPSSPRTYRDQRVGGGGVRRRHLQHRDDAVHPERARPRAARPSTRPQIAEQAEGGPRRGRRRHHPRHRQARAGRPRRPRAAADLGVHVADVAARCSSWSAA